ncbi:hypothetical protein [Burkholderia ubonensis]|nr:hypothetical protein [Burkholderia ubonensis]
MWSTWSAKRVQARKRNHKPGEKTKGGIVEDAALSTRLAAGNAGELA